MKKIKLGPIKTKHEGKIFSIKQREVFFPDGEKDTYEFCERPASVSVLALNEKKELLLINEYRFGYRRNVWFLPGGRMDEPGDTPRKAAMRELQQEGGFKAKKLKQIRKNSPSNTLMWDIYIFVATDLVHDPLPLDKGEEVSEIKFVPLKKAAQMAVDGTIENEFISYNIIRFEYMLRKGEFKI
ncbi:MAG: NUDIX domain-containing protein [Candidatus Magasanikbacteria bacterium]|nr:NUDIX domain-containing protein [Candidatus Magasanikbacteria bacterium]